MKCRAEQLHNTLDKLLFYRQLDHLLNFLLKRPCQTFEGGSEFSRVPRPAMKDLTMWFIVNGEKQGCRVSTQLSCHLAPTQKNNTNRPWNLFYSLFLKCPRRTATTYDNDKKHRGWIYLHLNDFFNSNNIHLFACTPRGVPCCITFLLHSLKG